MNRPIALLLLALACASGAEEAKKAKNRAQLVQPPPPAFEIPQPFIAYIYPAGGRRGQTVQATVSGTNLVALNALQQANSVQVNGRGVTARILGAKDATQVNVSISIAEDAEPGEREFRILSPGGVSNRFRFFVGDLPEMLETEPNSDKRQPQRIPSMPMVVNGQIMEGDRDYFRFDAKAGEKVVLQVQARRIIPFIADAVPGWFDPCIAIYDSEGRELKYADDFRIKSDPVLVFDPPKDSEYTVEIRDIIFRGRADFIYRLSVGVVPFVSHIFPIGGRRNSQVEVELGGVNLPASRKTISVPPDAAPKIRVESLPFAVSDMHEVFEAEPNDAGPQRVESPVIVNGRIGKPGDIDRFIIRAEARQKLLFEVQARRLDSPLDSILILMDGSGKTLAESDDWTDPADSPATHHADSRILFTVPSTGDYVLKLADVQGAGGDEYAYRLVIAPAQPDFSLRISPDNPRLGQGDTAAITVDAIRKDGFEGEIKLAVENLPPGFLASEAVIQGGQTQARITITAPRDASTGIVSPSVVGTAVSGGRTIARRADTAEPMMQAFASTHYMPTEHLALSVLKQSAFTLWAGDGKVLEVPRGAETPIHVKVNRTPAAKAPVTLTGQRGAPSITVRAVVCAADSEEATVNVAVAEDAPVGLTQNLIVTGVMRTGRDTITRYSPAIPIKVVAARVQ